MSVPRAQTQAGREAARYRFEIEQEGGRLDAFLAERVPELSRSRIKKLIDQGLISLDGRPAKAAARLKPGQVVELTVPPPEPAELTAEPLELKVVFEDEHLVVIDKPPGLVVHPAPGHGRGTLVHGLLHLIPDLKGVGGVERPGIVHRLDKETSGLIVIAKNDPAHAGLSAAFKDRRVRKAYSAVLLGRPKWEERLVEVPIGRHPTKRRRMAVVASGRPAASRFRVVEELKGPLSLVSVEIMTGRTHQIRVHAAHLGHPVAGDPVYGSRAREKKLSGPARAALAKIDRQMLHAGYLAFEHPVTGEMMELTAEPPPDMAGLTAELRRER